MAPNNVISGENAGVGMYATDRPGGGAGKHRRHQGERDRVRPPGMHGGGWSGSVGFSGVTVRPGDLSVLSI